MLMESADCQTITQNNIDTNPAAFIKANKNVKDHTPTDALYSQNCNVTISIQCIFQFDFQLFKILLKLAMRFKWV